MSDNKPLDGAADVLPVGLQPTPFGEVWQALQQVAASVWDVDPSVYRAGMAWLWYAVNHPDDLASDSLRALLVAALISEQAPMVKDWQTNAELVEYLRVWRTYSPTYAKLEAIFATFGARVEVRPISDAESQGVVPVADRRLAFYLRVEDFDAARPLTLDEVYQIAVRATPLGSRPVPYFALVGSSDVFAGPASAGLVRVLWASEPAEPVTPPTPVPTVSVNGDFGTNNWLFRNSDASVGSISAGGTQVLWIANDQYQVSYDSTKSYAVLTWYYGTGGSDVGANGALSIVNSSDYIAAKNETTSTVTLYALRCAVCSSADATVVHVYDKSTGTAYNAFKYASEGTDYYYILDGVQSDWSDDIDSLGFALGDGFTEITLYMASGADSVKATQGGVISAFTSDVVSNYCYRLYTDEDRTIVWNGYDYSNDYVLGNYRTSDGEWVEYIDTVAEMPAEIASSTSSAKIGYILLDNGRLWLCTNYTSSGYYNVNVTKIVVRIYPKAQQHYVRYLAYNNVYDNTTVTTANKSTYPTPMNGSSSNTSGWFQTFPKATITRLLMSAGNESQSVSGDEIAASTSYRMIFRQASAMSRTFRAIEYTLDRPTLHAWLKTDHTNKSTTSAALNDLYDDDGNLLMFDGDTSVVYVPIGAYTSTGANCSNNQLTLERSKFGRRSSGEWCFIQNYSTVSIARVWYVKYTDCKVAYFNANKTNYTWVQGTTRVLYDANGNQIPYDSTKTYTIIQLRESSHSVITPTFGDLALKSLINNLGYLACNAASGGAYSSLSVASVWYLEE